MSAQCPTTNVAHSLNVMLTCLIIVDKNLVIQYTNASTQQLFIQGEKRLLGAYLPVLFCDISLNTSTISAVFLDGQSFTDNEVNAIINGQLHVLSITAQRLSPQHVLLEILPLDNQQRLNKEYLLQSQQSAANALIRRLAHEIKNPLGGLRGAAQLLDKKLNNADLQEYTRLIIQQADRLHKLVDNLLGPQRLANHKL